ncbi:MAG: carbohydrate ABC transporter permease [Clostridiales bacterium]|nr:carbohydrate ABC transporter permease [Clostridiales bacterium]
MNAVGRKRAGLIVTYALLAILLVFMVFPVIVTVTNSFMPGWQVAGYKDPSAVDKALMLIPEQVTLKQYDSVLLNSPQYWDLFWNSVILTAPIVAGQLLVSALAAYFFTFMKNRFKEVLFFIYIVVMLLPFQVTLVPAYLTIDALGLVDTRLAVVLPGIFSTFGAFLLRMHMEQIPKSYIEAARMDGAGHFKVFWHVAAPMCKAGIVALCILCFIDNWNMIEQPLIFMQDEATQPLSLFFYSINQKAITVAFAASTVYMIPMMLVFLNGEKELMEGIRGLK